MAGLILLACAGPVGAQSSTTGAIHGVVKDADTGEALAGVTIVATSPAMEQSRAAISGSSGFYELTGLPPGLYTVTFYYGVRVVIRSAIEISVNRRVPVYLRMKVADVGCYFPWGGAPTIDTTSTRRGRTLDENYLRNIPLPGRTYQSALGAPRWLGPRRMRCFFGRGRVFGKRHCR